MRAPIVALVLFTTGCGGALAQGESQFDKGRYPEAKNTFLSIEAESRNYDDPHRAAYALYRGLTHAALGDRASAALWLREAKAIEDAHPGSLSMEDRRRLQVALDANEPPR
jgi:hypothetical protein